MESRPMGRLSHSIEKERSGPYPEPPVGFWNMPRTSPSTIAFFLTCTSETCTVSCVILPTWYVGGRRGRSGFFGFVRGTSGGGGTEPSFKTSWDGRRTSFLFVYDPCSTQEATEVGPGERSDAFQENCSPVNTVLVS